MFDVIPSIQFSGYYALSKRDGARVEPALQSIGGLSQLDLSNDCIAFYCAPEDELRIDEFLREKVIFHLKETDAQVEERFSKRARHEPMGLLVAFYYNVLDRLALSEMEKRLRPTD